jgi:hypothetical protein
MGLMCRVNSAANIGFRGGNGVHEFPWDKIPKDRKGWPQTGY